MNHATPHRSGPVTRALLVLALLLGTACSATGCTSDSPGHTTLTVLASSELADLRPLLDELRRDTGITLDLEYRGTVDASSVLGSGRSGGPDLAWLSSDRWLRLDLKEAGSTTRPVVTTRTMMSPLVIGVKRAAADRLRQDGGTGVSWADIARAAARGSLGYALADPNLTNSGLGALVAVATADAGTGEALRPEDVTRDPLRGFLNGRVLTAPTTGALVEAYVDRQDGTDALIAYESDLLTLNAGGRLREPLELVYPRDGIVLSDFPLLLLDPAKRAAYDRVAAWLLTPAAQKRIMQLTLRRPVDPTVPRDPRLERPIGNALYFPDQPEVVRRLLAHYTADTSPPLPAVRPTLPAGPAPSS
ncbi:substrate-binding domain-containing protein [Kitasatospora sp. NPDC093806]|uniref:substrate-binding domain-containing protein n=1 Tax=Kitasatospora sp. NPDC093806 TaxID=3155075 RepID=UPI0034407880